MRYRIIAATIAFFIGFLGAAQLYAIVTDHPSDVFPYVGGFALAAYVGTRPVEYWPIVLLLIERAEAGRKRQAEHRQRALIAATSRKTIVAFGEEIERPTFFVDLYRRDPKPFKATVYWHGRDDQLVTGRIVVSGTDELTQRRMLEALIESARMLRHERGYPLTDRLNETIWPDVYPAGILIEKVENDDGTTSAILAVGARGVRNRQDWVNANAKGFDSFRSAWAERPIFKADVQMKDGSMRRFDSISMPLLDLILEEIVLPAERPTDALGGVSVTLDRPADLHRG